MVGIGVAIMSMLLSMTSLGTAVDYTPPGDRGATYSKQSYGGRGEGLYGAHGRGESGRGYDDTKESEQKESKYYYGGQFKEKCQGDGLYYKDDATFVMCSNGYPHEQPCPPGTKTSGHPAYKAGYYYGYTDLCSVNLVDYGLGPEHYAPNIAYEAGKEGTHKKESSNYGGKLEGSYGKKETLQEYKDKDLNKNYNRKDDYPKSDVTYPKPDATYPNIDSPAGYPSPNAGYNAQKDLYPTPSHGDYPAPTQERNYPAYDRAYPDFGAYSPMGPYAYPQRNPYNQDAIY